MSDSNESDHQEGADPVADVDAEVVSAPEESTEVKTEVAEERSDTAPVVEAKAEKSKRSFIKNLTHMHYLLMVAVLIIVGLIVVILSEQPVTETETVTLDTSEDEPAVDIDDVTHSDAGTEESFIVEESNALLTDKITWLAKPKLSTDVALFTPASVTAFYADKGVDFGYDISSGRLGNIHESYEIGSSAKAVIHYNRVLTGVGLDDIYAVFYTVTDKATGEITLTQWRSRGLVDTVTNELDLPGIILTVAVVEDGSIPELDYEDTITYDGVTVERTSEWYMVGRSGGDLNTITRLADWDSEMADQVILGTTVGSGNLYEVVRNLGKSDGIKTVELLLELPSGARVQYRYITDLMKDDGSIAVQWNDGSQTEDVYRWDLVWAGCGAVNQPLVLDKKYHPDLQTIGKSGSQDIFGLNRADHPAIKTLYDSSGAGLSKTITVEEFYNDRPVLVVRNDLGYYLVLNNEKYQRAAECAKPVIYLYPETPTKVHVEVGAEVTKSEPLYDNGWDAIATPSGKLLTRTGVYDSLFWDGIGEGEYPETTKGNFVKRSDLEETLVANMTQMGLNEKERADFLEYWMPLMPDTNYVRITWLNTEEMNALAPLRLSFTPDSMIRIFLDFEGVDKPYELESQRLPSYTRHGFSLIEWGGLRIGL